MGNNDGTNRLNALEGLRGIACLMVVLFHLPLWHPALESNIIRNSHVMVDFFFVLSGFIISRTYLDRIQNWNDLLRFQLLRFGRLYPVHFVMLIAFLGLECVRYYLWTYSSSPGSTPPFETNNPIAFAQHLLLLQSIVPNGNSMTFNVPSWSISTEFYTYIIFAIVALLARKFIAIATIAIILGSLAIFTTTDSELKLLSGCILGFFIGVSVDMISRNTQYKTSPLVFIAALIALLSALMTLDGTKLHYSILPLSALIVFSAVNARGTIQNKVFGNSLMTQLGAYSFTIYMTHSFVIWIMDSALKRTVAKATGSTNPGMLNELHAILAIIATLACTMAVSIAIKRLIEDPARTWIRGYADKRAY